MKTHPLTHPKPFRRNQGVLERLMTELAPVNRKPTAEDIQVLEKRRGLEKRLRFGRFNGQYYFYQTV